MDVVPHVQVDVMDNAVMVVLQIVNQPAPIHVRLYAQMVVYLGVLLGVLMDVPGNV